MPSSAFLLTSLVVIMAPGPDLALLSQLVLRYRRRGPAVAAAAGMVVAGVVQVGVGFAGVAVLLQTNPWVLTALRWAGAAVLVVWGLLALRAGLMPPAGATPTADEVPVTDAGNNAAGRAFWQGFLCTATNPKVGIFLVAFLPQFAAPTVTGGPPVAVLAVVYLSICFGWLVIWTSLIDRLSPLLLGPRATRVASCVIGVVFVAVGARLALSA